MILVSACLSGEKCRYDGNHNLVEKIAELVQDGKAIICCPELSGGLPTPRVPAEIIGGTGADVLDGKAKVVTKDGVDVTAEFVAGAYKALEYAKEHHVTAAILKERSPSCGSELVYDGTFSGRKVNGEGVTAALLRRNGITVYSDENMESFLYDNFR